MQGHRSTNPHASEATPPGRFSDEIISSWSGWFIGESSSIRNVGNQNPVHEERLGHGRYEPANSSSPLNLELSLGRGESSHSPSLRSGGIPQSFNLFEGHASPGFSSTVPLLPCKRKAPVEGAEHLSLGPSNDSVEHHHYQVGGSAVTPVTETVRQACPHVQSHSGLLLRDGASSSGIGGLSVTSGDRTPVLPQGEDSRNVRRVHSDLPANVPVIDLTNSPDHPPNFISGSTTVTNANAHNDNDASQRRNRQTEIRQPSSPSSGSEAEDEGAEIYQMLQSGPTVVLQENALTEHAHRQAEPMTADSDLVYSSEDEDEYINMSGLLQPDSGLQEDVYRDSQAIAARSERRNRLLSEVRNVMAVLRSGGQLNLEELTLHPSWFGRLIAMHDAQQNMRVDVDNMSYEELLALGERIGNVSTGLSEETTERYLKTVKFYTPRYGSTKPDSCCICQDAFVKGVKLGRLDCDHDFHPKCIKRWLREKNVCPVCRKTALANGAST